MKISEFHIIRAPHPWKTRIFVVLGTSDGLRGIGEATVGQVSQGVEGTLHDLKPFIVGKDLHDTQQVRLIVERDIYTDGGQISRAALAGVEMAMWDLIGQSAGKPLYQLLGGKTHDKLRAYANGWYRSERDPLLVAKLARNVVNQGYTALKIDPFGAGWRGMSRRELELSLNILRAVKDAVGPSVDLIVEGHSRFDVATACEVATSIESLNPLWFEEPIPYSDLRGYQEVVARSPVPIAAGESLWRIDQFVNLITHVNLPIIQFDPIHVGGVSNSKTIVELALAENRSVALHSASGVVNETVCAHLTTASPHALVLERFLDADKEDVSAAHIKTSLVTEGGGFARLEETPGLGCQFDLAELLSLHSPEHAKDQNLFKHGWEKRTGQRL